MSIGIKPMPGRIIVKITKEIIDQNKEANQTKEDFLDENGKPKMFTSKKEITTGSGIIVGDAMKKELEDEIPFEIVAVADDLSNILKAGDKVYLKGELRMDELEYKGEKYGITTPNQVLVVLT